MHRFTADGRLLHSWGEEGTGPGQFGLPHCLRVDSRGRVLVLDRSNRRLQVFDAEGVYLDEWPDLDGPNDLYIDENDNVYIAEGNFRISVFDLDGKLLARWGEPGEGAGRFTDHPHGLWLDTTGDLYVAEVATLHNRLQKFTRE
jgi:DNA-binding beta-propeller fold protein YncE